MRRTLTLCRTGLAGVAAVVLLTACGGGDSSDSAATTSASETTSSSAAESSATGGAADSQFCQDAVQLQTDLQSTPDLSDPAAAGPAFQQIADRVRQVEPPEEIAADWTALADGIEQLAQIFTNTDFTDPQQAAAAEQQATQLEAQLTSASTNVENYLSTECGIDTGSSPTS
jgi:hypothetical protein